MPEILTDREAIRQWVAARGGNPVLMDIPDGSKTRTVLQLAFGQEALNSDGNQGPDRVGGFQLVSWEEWFTALDQGIWRSRSRMTRLAATRPNTNLSSATRRTGASSAISILAALVPQAGCRERCPSGATPVSARTQVVGAGRELMPAS